MNVINLTHFMTGESGLEIPSKADCTFLLCRNSSGSSGETQFQESMAALILPGEAFSMPLTPGAEVYTMEFPPSMLPETLQPDADQAILLLPDPAASLLSYYIATWSILESAGPNTPRHIADASLSALLNWAAHLSRKPGQSPAGAHSRQLVDQAKAIIHAEYAGDLTLQSVAERLFVNPCYLSTIFHQVTGVTFRNYLKTVRLRHTKRLLTETNHLVTDIAMQTGWGSTAYLISSFRQAYGVTPNAYRSLHTGRQ